MKKAIITGATGLVGMAVARYLTSCGIEVLCLGRKAINKLDISLLFGETATYLKLPMEEIASLAEKIKTVDWAPDSACVFFNFAWQGDKKLTDGSFEDQLKNAIFAAEAVRVAKKLGCTKFVNAGTLEESFVEQFLATNKEHTYQSTQTDYALAKLASRDMCKMLAYLEKIDYVHTRLSVPLAANLSSGTYVSVTLKKILEGNAIERPISKQLFDIIFTDDVARAYYLIGLNGKNKADYFIGTSQPATLGHYFERFTRLVEGKDIPEAEIKLVYDTFMFDTKPLKRDTGFVAASRLSEVIEMYRSHE
jgi:nucleoside-diphosphate-sugar epimerase